MEAIVLAIALGIGAWIVFGTKESAAPVRREPVLPPPNPHLIEAGDQVWLLGDSLALGLTSHMEKFATESGVALKTTAKNGAPIAWGKTKAVTPPIASVWLVCLGANDAAGMPSGAQVRDSVLWILRRAETDGVREVIWLLPPNGGGLKHWQTVTEAISEVAWIVRAPEGLPFASDGVHLVGDGYKTWAEHVWKDLVS